MHYKVFEELKLTYRFPKHQLRKQNFLEGFLSLRYLNYFLLLLIFL